MEERKIKRKKYSEKKKRRKSVCSFSENSAIMQENTFHPFE